MFNNQENLFLQAIQKMLSSTGNEARMKAEEDIKLWAKESYVQILESCTKFIYCEQLDINTRRYASYLLTILISEENYENWQKLDNSLKNTIQMYSLSLLGNKNKEIRQSASVLVSSIEKICINNKEWKNLITTLCNACESNEIEFKISSIKTLGLIWESLKINNFTNDELVLMENTIIKTLLSSNSLDLSLESLSAYQYFIKYIFERFKNEEYLQSTLKMLTNFCNLKNYNEEVAKTAIHRISDVIIIAYDYMKTNINNIIEFIGIICNGENEQLAIQGYILLIEFSQEEYNRLEKNIKCFNYIDSAWNIIWKVIQNTLNSTRDPAYNNEYNRYKSLSSLLYYISKICNDKILDDIFIYMKDKMNDNNPLLENSAIYIFASILETVHYSKIKNVVYSSITPLSNFFNIKNEQLNKTVAWCFEKICENHGDIILKNPDKCEVVLNMILNILKNNDFHAKIKIYLCTALLYLTKIVKQSELQNLGVFSHHLLDLLKTLDNLAFLPSSFDQDYNLSKYCFIALSGLIDCSHDIDDEILTFFLDQLIERFCEAYNGKNFKNKEWQYQTQSLLCMVLERYCKPDNNTKLTYQKIELFFNKIESFFQQRGIFEEGLQALSRLSLLISNKEFSQFLRVIMEHIFNCLKEYQDFSNCKTALISLFDLIRTSKENFTPYIENLIKYFQEIIKKPDANKELFSYFLIIYSDLFEYTGESIWMFVQIPLEYMKYILNFCINNCGKYLSDNVEKEDYLYFLSLNDNVMDLIENILKRIINETNERKKAFYQYVPNIIYYINIMFKNVNFVPSIDYLLSTISILFDLIEIYKDNILQLINDDTRNRLSSLANATRAGEIIEINESLQNFINSFKYNIDLNKDYDIF